MTNKLTISNYMNQSNVNSYLEGTLGDKKNEFVSNLIAISDQDKNLSKCEHGALIKCAMNATALNLPLNKNLGYAYVIPYGTNPQFQLGYKGFIQLAIRSGQYKVINSCEVREGEVLRNKFTGEMTFFEENEDGEIVGFMAYIELHNGFRQSMYMSVKEMTNHAKKYSRSFNSNSSIWKSDFNSMGKKTVLKLLLSRYGILSTEMQKAIIVDQTVDGEYVDNPSNSNRQTVEAQVVEQVDEETGELKELKF